MIINIRPPVKTMKLGTRPYKSYDSINGKFAKYTKCSIIAYKLTCIVYDTKI